MGSIELALHHAESQGSGWPDLRRGNCVNRIESNPRVAYEHAVDLPRLAELRAAS